MILHPAIIALLAGSALVAFMLLYSSWYGIEVIRKWDLRSGSELQLSLEKKTYLISTMMAYAMGFQLISLFLFVYTADSLCSLFTGAMCAAGTLNVNDFGYPVFLLKLVNFLFGGLWLVLNYTDNRAYDYPMIRKKYFFLIALMPLVLAEVFLQARYFFGLEAEIITSCCGSLFSSSDRSAAPGIFALPVRLSTGIFYGWHIFVLGLGVFFYKTGKGAYFFGIASLLLFFISGWALIQFISLYIYELPTHHCPFCMLKQEYGHVGYLYYISALAGCVAGTGVGMLQRFRHIASLEAVIPGIQKRLTIVSVTCYLFFMLAATYAMVFSGFRL